MYTVESQYEKTQVVYRDPLFSIRYVLDSITFLLVACKMIATLNSCFTVCNMIP